jgi:rare lipoprotein A
VRIGPLRDPAEADAALDRALRAGVSDARIVVDAP